MRTQTIPHRARAHVVPITRGEGSFDSLASFDSFPLKLEADSQSYLTFAAPEVARAFTDR